MPAKENHNGLTVDVAVARPLWQPLSYMVGPELAKLIRPLTRLVVPVRGKNVLGFALSRLEERSTKGLKPIKDVLDDPRNGSAWPEGLLRFFQRASAYYQTPLGQVLAWALPAGLGGLGKASGSSPRAKEEVVISLRQGREEDLPRKNTQAAQLLEKIGQADSLALSELRSEFPRVSQLARQLEQRGWAVLSHRLVVKDLCGRELFPEPRPEKLTEEQANALNRLEPAVKAAEFKSFLIHGVTGSGKTELYLRAVEAALEKGRQALVLTPEIGLCLRLEGLFRARLGQGNVAVLHSGLTPAARRGQWMAISSGRVKVVVGARSAVFAPLSDPGVICVDEEQDEAYKQEDRMGYHARDLALLRGQEQKCPVVLGTATPAVVTRHRAQSGAMELISLKKRVKDVPLPAMQVVDMRKAGVLAGGFLSPVLYATLKKTVAKNGQVLLFLNRRGFAPALICQDCGKPLGCPHCSLSLTYHRQSNSLKCHTCGFQRSVPEKCPQCGAGIEAFKPIGLGTESVARKLAEMEPDLRLARLDTDTAGDHRKLSKMLKLILDHEVDVVIGTQMISKGHHFPDLKLVGVLMADQALSLPDFRAAERAYTLLSQVAGRAGREGGGGKVIVQTYDPEHHALVGALNHEPDWFYETEIAERKALNYPPFTRLVSLRLEGEKEERVAKAAGFLAGHLRKAQARLEPGAMVLGPAPAPVVKVQDRFRYLLLLKALSAGGAARIMRLALHNTGPLPFGVRLRVDVDPVNLL